MQTFDYVFIGAGLANLAAARIISETHDNRVLILDAGKDLTDRVCPGVRPQKCVFCSNGCSIISGTGGSNALFGNKLCYFPASPGVLEFFSPVVLASAWAWLDTTLSDWFDSSNNRPTEPHPLGLKHYEAEVFSPAQFRKMVHSLAHPLLTRDVLRLRSEVVDVAHDSGEFRIALTSGDVYRTHAVVLGTGRSGGSLVRRTCAALGIPISGTFPDVGVRVEAPTSLFSDFYNYQEDPKLKQSFPEGTVRTFCAENGGLIVPVPLGRAFFAEGAYPTDLRETNNIALMVRSANSLTPNELQAWCARINGDQNGTLLTAELQIPKGTPSALLHEVASIIPALPTAQHDYLMVQLLQMLSSAATPLFRETSRSTCVRLYAPAVDNYWPVPEVYPGLRTRVPGFYIIGDAAGLSRGYVQALTSGAAWALTLSTESEAYVSSGVSQCLVSA